MIKIIHLINALNERIGKTISWLSIALIFVFIFDVTLRYVFDFTLIWVTELETYLFVFLFLFAIGYALKHDRHVRVDVFYSKLSKRRKAWVNLIGTIFFLFPWIILVVMVGWKYAHFSYLINESSPQPGGLPALYILKSSIFIGFILLGLQGVSLLFQSITTIQKK